MQNTTLIRLNECIFSEENDKHIFSEDNEKEQKETANFARDTIRSSVKQGDEQLDPEDFVLESSPSVHGNQSLSPDSDTSEQVDASPTELCDECPSDFRESKVLMSNVVINELDLDFPQQSHEMPSRNQNIVG